MITLIGRVLRIHTVLGGVGGCCLPGVRYLTKEKVTAKDKRQWHVPGSVTGTFSESEKSNRSLFSRYKKKKKKMSAGPSHALSGQSQAVLSEASRNGDTLGPSGRCCSMSGAQPHMFCRLPKQHKKGVKLGFRAHPRCQGISPQLWPSQSPPHQLQYMPLPVSPALMAPKAVLSPGPPSSRSFHSQDFLLPLLALPSPRSKHHT